MPGIDVWWPFIVGSVFIPYFLWIVTSIFSIRQEVALLKQSVDQNKELFELLRDRLQ